MLRKNINLLSAIFGTVSVLVVSGILLGSAFTTSSWAMEEERKGSTIIQSKSLDLLPEEVQIHILKYCGIKGLGAVSQLSTYWHDFAEDNGLWKEARKKNPTAQGFSQWGPRLPAILGREVPGDLGEKEKAKVTVEAKGIEEEQDKRRKEKTREFIRNLNASMYQLPGRAETEAWLGRQLAAARAMHESKEK